MTTKIISKLAPKNDGSFPTHSDIHGEGGYQVRDDITDRNNIPTLNRKEGMLVKVLSDGVFYTLSGGITNGDWVEASFGGFTAGGDLDGDASSQTVVAIGGIPIETPISYEPGSVLGLEQVPNPFDQPRTMFVDSSNKLWVGDINTGIVSIINPTLGIIEKTIDLSSFGFTSVRRMTGDSTYVYVCSPQNSTTPRRYVLIISIIDREVVGVCDVGLNYRARDHVADGSGNLWVTAIGATTKLVKFNIATVTAAFPTPTTFSLTAPITGVSYHCLTIGGGFLWSGLNFDEKIYKLDLVTGVKLAENVGNTTVQANDILYFSGSLWATGNDNILMKFDPNTLSETDITINGGAIPFATLGEMFGTSTPHDSILIGGVFDNECYRVHATTNAIESYIIAPNTMDGTVERLPSIVEISGQLYIASSGNDPSVDAIAEFTSTIGSETFVKRIQNGITISYLPSSVQFMVVADHTARDALIPGVRSEGMLVHVLSDNRTYTLTGGITNTNWMVYAYNGYSTQNDWWIDPSTGNDANSGAPGSPLQTFREFARRMNGVLKQRTNVAIFGNLPSTDPLAISLRVEWDKILSPSQQPDLNIAGVTNASGIYTGTVTSATNATPASNLPPTLTDTAVADYTPYVGKIIRITNFPNPDTSAWVVLDVGSNTARVSEWASSNGFSGGAMPAPINTNTYKIYDQIEVASSPDVFVSGGSGSNIGATVIIQNIKFTGGQTQLQGSNTHFYQCSFPGMNNVTSTKHRFAACYFAGATSGDNLTFNACSFNTSGMSPGVNVTLNDCLFQAVGIQVVQGKIIVFSTGIFDHPGAAVYVQQFGFLGAVSLYGSNNLSAFSIYNSDMIHNGLYITGTTELNIDGAVSFLPGLSASAGGSLPALSSCVTWAELLAAPFNGKLINYDTGTRITPA